MEARKRGGWGNTEYGYDFIEEEGFKFILPKLNEQQANWCAELFCPADEARTKIMLAEMLVVKKYHADLTMTIAMNNYLEPTYYASEMAVMAGIYYVKFVHKGPWLPDLQLWGEIISEAEEAVNELYHDCMNRFTQQTEIQQIEIPKKKTKKEKYEEDKKLALEKISENEKIVNAAAADLEKEPENVEKKKIYEDAKYELSVSKYSLKYIQGVYDGTI